MDPKELKAVPLFSSLSKKQLEALARWTDEVDVQQDKHLADEGDFAYEFFLIREGTASVEKEGEHIRELGPGDFFGEIGLIESERRTATVIATSPMRLIVMSGRDFRHMADEMPEIAEDVRVKIKERLQRA